MFFALEKYLSATTKEHYIMSRSEELRAQANEAERRTIAAQEQMRLLAAPPPSDRVAREAWQDAGGLSKYNAAQAERETQRELYQKLNRQANAAAREELTGRPASDYMRDMSISDKASGVRAQSVQQVAIPSVAASVQAKTGLTSSEWSSMTTENKVLVYEKSRARSTAGEGEITGYVVQSAAGGTALLSPGVFEKIKDVPMVVQPGPTGKPLTTPYFAPSSKETTKSPFSMFNVTADSPTFQAGPSLAIEGMFGVQPTIKSSDTTTIKPYSNLAIAEGRPGVPTFNKIWFRNPETEQTRSFGISSGFPGGGASYAQSLTTTTPERTRAGAAFVFVARPVINVVDRVTQPAQSAASSYYMKNITPLFNDVDSLINTPEARKRKTALANELGGIAETSRNRARQWTPAILENPLGSPKKAAATTIQSSLYLTAFIAQGSAAALRAEAESPSRAVVKSSIVTTANLAGGPLVRGLVNTFAVPDMIGSYRQERERFLINPEPYRERTRNIQIFGSAIAGAEVLGNLGGGYGVKKVAAWRGINKASTYGQRFRAGGAGVALFGGTAEGVMQSVAIDRIEGRPISIGGAVVGAAFGAATSYIPGGLYYAGKLKTASRGARAGSLFAEAGGSLIDLPEKPGDWVTDYYARSSRVPVFASSPSYEGRVTGPIIDVTASSWTPATATNSLTRGSLAFSGSRSVAAFSPSLFSFSTSFSPGRAMVPFTDSRSPTTGPTPSLSRTFALSASPSSVPSVFTPSFTPTYNPVYAIIPAPSSNPVFDFTASPAISITNTPTNTPAETYVPVFTPDGGGVPPFGFGRGRKGWGWSKKTKVRTFYTASVAGAALGLKGTKAERRFGFLTGITIRPLKG